MTSRSDAEFGGVDPEGVQEHGRSILPISTQIWVHFDRGFATTPVARGKVGLENVGFLSCRLGVLVNPLIGLQLALGADLFCLRG